MITTITSSWHPSSYTVNKTAFVLRIFIYSLSSSQICNTVLLTIVTMLYITPPWHLFYTHFKKQLPLKMGLLHLLRISYARPFLLAAAVRMAQCILLSEWFLEGHARRHLGMFLKHSIWHNSATEPQGPKKFCEDLAGLCPSITIPDLQVCCKPVLEFTRCSAERSHSMTCVYICTFFSYIPSTLTGGRIPGARSFGAI